MAESNQSYVDAVRDRLEQPPQISGPLAPQGAEHGQDVDQHSAKRIPSKGKQVPADSHNVARGGTLDVPEVVSGRLSAADEDRMATLGGGPSASGTSAPDPVSQGSKTIRRRRSGRSASLVVNDSVNPRGILQLLERQQYRCALTGRPLTPQSAAMDHIVPICRGGQHRIENTQVLEHRVNRAKGTLTNEEFITLCWEVSRRHPRAGATIHNHRRTHAD